MIDSPIIANAKEQPLPKLPEIEGDYLLAFAVDKNLNVFAYVDAVVAGAIIALLIAIVAWRLSKGWSGLSILKSFEIDEAELGLGNQKLKLRPNQTDRQIAYKIWVELGTRKIGIPIDLEHDVIVEIYDSWYSFFSVTRELVKDVPVSKFRRKDTKKIVELSIEVLNAGIRPHLTQWQARFRRWYDKASAREDADGSTPQEIQKSYPDYGKLAADLEAVNRRLILYRKKMYELVVR